MLRLLCNGTFYLYAIGRELDDDCCKHHAKLPYGANNRCWNPRTDDTKRRVFSITK